MDGITQKLKRKIRSSYITSVVSITLVLYLLSIIGLIIANTRKLATHVKENIGMTVVLKDDIKEADVTWLQKELDANKYVKNTQYVTKEEAAEQLVTELGEDFVGFLGYNPLSSSFDVNLHAEYASPDQMEFLKAEFSKYSQVKDVFYQESLVHLVNKNVRSISMIILMFSLLLLIISIALINNTMRLKIYSHRFIIRTMQFVGATEAFIRRPYIANSTVYGVISAIIALSGFYVTVYLLQHQFEDLVYFEGVGVVSIVIVTVGILITDVSTFFAVNKYLRINTNELYY